MTSSRVLGFVSLTAALLAAAPAAAETHHPYAGQEKRGIKALSDVEIGDLMAGRGMGLAKAAELNGFPGPMHVLEHEKALNLTQAQRAAIAEIRTRMAAAAQVLGREIVEAERALETSFAEKRIDAGLLKTQTEAIAALMGRLRAVHLAAHIETKALLSETQIAQYAALRGYSGDAPPQRHHHPRQH